MLCTNIATAAQVRAHGLHGVAGAAHRTGARTMIERINPSVRDAEIRFFEDQLAAVGRALDGAGLRLDALRIIAAI